MFSLVQTGQLSSMCFPWFYSLVFFYFSILQWLDDFFSCFYFFGELFCFSFLIYINIYYKISYMNTICQHALILNSHSFPNSSQIYLPPPLFASSVFSFFKYLVNYNLCCPWGHPWSMIHLPGAILLKKTNSSLQKPSMVISLSIRSVGGLLRPSLLRDRILTALILWEYYSSELKSVEILS